MPHQNEAAILSDKGNEFKHPSAPDNSQLRYLSPPEQAREIDLSLVFRKEIGAPTARWVMCYPYGDYNDSLLRILEERHGSLGLATKPGLSRMERSTALTLERRNANDFPKSAEGSGRLFALLLRHGFDGYHNFFAWLLNLNQCSAKVFHFGEFAAFGQIDSFVFQRGPDSLRQKLKGNMEGGERHVDDLIRFLLPRCVDAYSQIFHRNPFLSLRNLLPEQLKSVMGAPVASNDGDRPLNQEIHPHSCEVSFVFCRNRGL
jgi:hypothetical protein